MRVFTYAVGQNPNPTNDIEWMACANRGRTQLFILADVLTRVVTLQVPHSNLNQTLALSNASEVHFQQNSGSFQNFESSMEMMIIDIFGMLFYM